MVIEFSTALFDVTKERPNDSNQIYGESLLHWLAERLKGQVVVPTPQPEDWGWYSDIDWKGRVYMLGASSEEESNEPREWVLQIVKNRSIKEKLLGKEKMTQDDTCVAHIRNLLEEENAFSNVRVSWL